MNYFTSVILVWNELSLQIRRYNEAHALICHRLKLLVQDLFRDAPELKIRLEADVKRLTESCGAATEQVKTLTEANSALEEEVRAVRLANLRLTATVDSLECNERRRRADISDMLFQMDEQHGHIQELEFHVAKRDDQVRVLTAQLKDLLLLADSQKERLASQDALIAQYKSRDIGFEPLYERASAELQDARAQLAEATEALEVLRIRKETRDFGTEPIAALAETGRKAQRATGKPPKSGRQILANFKAHKLAGADGSDGFLHSLPGTQRPLELTMTHELHIPQPLLPLRSGAHTPQLSRSGSVVSRLLLGAPLADLTGRHDSAPEEKEEEQKHEESGEVPEDYHVPDDVLDEHLAVPPAMVTYVDRLFAMPLVEAVTSAPQFVTPAQTYHQRERKSLVWTLRRVVLVMRNAFEADSLLLPRYDFMELLTAVIGQTANTPQMIERVERNLLCSIDHWKNQSPTIQFFLKFLSGEYSVPDFRFFNMVFTFCYHMLYPPVEDFLEDPNIEDDTHAFLLHRKHFNKICRIVLRLDKFPEKNWENVMRGVQLTDPYSDLIPVWLFAHEMISLFRQCHRQFQKQIRHVMKITMSESERMTRDRFPDFCKILLPGIRGEKIMDMWGALCVIESTSADIYEVKYHTLLKFCSEYPGLARAIQELPYLESFDRAWGGMPEPMVALFGFIVQRYVDFLPKFFEHVKPDLREALDPYVTKLRNGLLKCDLSTCMMCYRYMMQYVDLKITEQNPFQIITMGITQDDVARVINHIMMRERLATVMLHVKEEVDDNTLIARELGMNPKEVERVRKVASYKSLTGGFPKLDSAASSGRAPK
jgi:hypothetical protein